MATLILRPAGDSSVNFTRSTGATNYTLVDEASSDSDSTYVYTTSTTAVDLYTTDDTEIDNNIPVGSTIDSVQLTYVAKRASSSNRSLAAKIRLSGNDTDGTLATPGGLYSSYITYMSRPGGGSWSIQDLKDLTFGIYSGTGSGANAVRCTQVYLTITYTEPVDAKITGYVKDWASAAPVPGVKIKLYHSGVLQSSSYSNDSGYYETATLAPSSATVLPVKYQWQFTPTYATPSGLSGTDVSRDFTLGPDTWWPNVASTYAFRKPILFSTPHPTLTKNTLIKIPIATGKQVAIANNAMADEGADHSAGNNIAYFDNKTHVVYKGNDDTVWGVTKNHLDNTWTAPFKITRMGGTDAHFNPNIDIDSKGYINLVVSAHNNNPGTYYLLSTPNQLNSKPIHTSDAGSQVTYPRIRCDKYDRTYIFFRQGLSELSHASYVWKPSSLSTAWSTPQKVVAAAEYLIDNSPVTYSNESVYLGGAIIDDNNYIHLVASIDDTYGSTNYWGTMYYLYSPPSWDAANSTTRPGLYWYDIKGIRQAICTTNTVLPLRYQSNTALSAIVAQAFQVVQTPGDYSYQTNTEGLAVHPTLTYNNGKHTVKRAYFTFSETDNNVENNFGASLCKVAWYDSASPRANSFGWAIANISTAIVTNGYASSSRAWKARHYGSIAIDRSGDIYVYGFNKEGTNQHSAWYGGELQEWSSRNNGTTWDWRLITRRSSMGVPMVNTKKNMSNNLLELIYGRGNKIFYYAEDLQEPKFRDNGYDVGVYYIGTNSGVTAIDCVADYWNYSSSQVYFKLSTNIPTNWVYSTAGQYYIYYGRYTTSPFISNPANIYGVYESFEGYTVDSSVSCRNRWRFNGGRSSLDSGYYIIKDSIDQHTMKMVSGDKCLYGNANIADYCTAYAYTSLPTGYTNNVCVEGSMWSEILDYGMIGVTYGSTDTVLAVGFQTSPTPKWTWFDGRTWRTSDVCTPILPTLAKYHHYKVSCVNGSVNFFVNGGSSSIAKQNIIVPNGSINKIILGNANPSNYSGEPFRALNLFDFIRAYKVTPQE